MTTGVLDSWQDVHDGNPSYRHAAPPFPHLLRRDDPTLFHDAGGAGRNARVSIDATPRVTEQELRRLIRAALERRR
jgi:hypothetical protein